MRIRILIAGAAAFLNAAAFAAVKPLAIWNGEFNTNANATANVPVRNGVSFSKGSVKLRGQYFQLTSTSAGADVEKGSANVAQAIIANISNIQDSQNNQTIFSFWTKSGSTYTDKLLLLFDTSKKINTGNSSNSGTASADTVDTSRMHSFGLFATTTNTYGFVDGDVLHTNASLTKQSSIDGIRIGTWGSFTTATKKYNLSLAMVSYVAIFPDDAALALEDFATWSLNEMTSAETATNNTALIGGDGVGINLTGGVFRVSGATAAHALFVQEDSTLEFGGSSPSLTLAGPVYVAPNRKLTMRLADGVNSASLEASHFADDGQIEAAEDFTRSDLAGGVITVTRNGAASTTVLHNLTEDCKIRGVSPEDVRVMASDEDGEIDERFDITAAFRITDDGDDGVDVEFAPEPPSFENVTVDDEEVSPMQFVGDDIVFGVRTVPGLWYATVATNDISAMDAAIAPMTTPFMATNEGAKITAPTFVPPLMFYKIIVAPSKAAIGDVP